MLFATMCEIHGPNFTVKLVYKLCDFCLAKSSVVEAHTEKEIFGLS